MLRIKYNQAHIKRRITVALALICLIVCTVDVQLYFEQRILANVATCTNKFDRQKNYFDMSLSELMNVVLVSQSDERPRSCLFDSYPYNSGLAYNPV
jgi:hypothetical protein